MTKLAAILATVTLAVNFAPTGTAVTICEDGEIGTGHAVCYEPEYRNIQPRTTGKWRLP